MLGRLGTLLAVGLLHLCSPVAALNAWAPRAGIVVTRDIAYAPGPRHRLDVYAPRHAAGAPVVVFFYGGGWETGDKAMYRFVGAALAAQGMVAVLPDYRLHPAVRFPAFVQDGAAAAAWARANAGRFGGDPRRLFLMGHSAGAQIAALLGLDPSYLRAAGVAAEHAVCGVIGLAGPYDFLPGSDGVNAVFGAPEAWPRAQPINFVSREEPALLLLAGQLDRTVDPGNSRRLAERARTVGGRVRLRLLPGLSHRALVVALAAPLSLLGPVRGEVARFVSAERGKGVGGGCRGVE